MIPVRMHIGVDVGKDWLDVCYPDGRKEHVRNIKSCRAKLVARAAESGAIVSFEATGPYEEPLADECLPAACAVSGIHRVARCGLPLVQPPRCFRRLAPRCSDGQARSLAE